jgi:O-antigen/teichoic acid export membrane protein
MLGRGVGYLAQYAFVAACTRALGGESSGAVLAVLSLVYIAAVVGRFGLDSCGLREVSVSIGRNDFIRARQQGLRVLAASGIFSGLILTVVWTFRSFLLNAIGLSELATEELLFLLIPLFTITGVLGELIRATRRMFASAVTQLILIYMIPVFLLVPDWSEFETNSFGVFAGLATGGGLSLCFGAVVFLRATRTSIRTSAVSLTAFNRKRLFQGAPHFMAMSVTTMYLANIDIIAVSRYLGQSDVAVYVACTRTAMVVSLGLIGIGGILAPYFASAYATKDTHRLTSLVNAGARWCAYQGVIAATILLILARPLLSFFGEGFDEFSFVLAILILGQFINTAFGPLAVLLSMTDLERQGAAILMVTAILGTVAYSIMIPRFGLLGAALANMSVVILWNFGMAWLAWQRLESGAPYIRIGIALFLLLPVWFADNVIVMTQMSIVPFTAGSVVLMTFVAWFLVLKSEDRAVSIRFVQSIVGLRRKAKLNDGREQVE